MQSNTKESLFQLVRLGIGVQTDTVIPGDVDWSAVGALAIQQGLLGFMTDGIDRLPLDVRPPKEVLLQFIGQVMQDESRYTIRQKAAAEMARLFHENDIRTYVLKGTVVAECYPKPEHRVSVDLDCFLVPERNDFDAWSLGNELIKQNGFEVSDGFYKNSTFYLPGLTVENHKFMTPFRGNAKLKALEVILQSIIKEDAGTDRFEQSWLFRPPVLITSLFLIEHAYSHFLHEGLTWRHVLDWVMFSRKHEKEIDWSSLDALIDAFGFRRFYDSYKRLGLYLLGDLDESELTRNDKLMLADVWADLDLHETLHGVKGKLALAGNTWRARWKYHYFAEITWLRALLIQTKGVLFIKNPKLG